MPVSQAVKYLHFIDIVLCNRDNQDTRTGSNSEGGNLKRQQIGLGCTPLIQIFLETGT